MVYTMISKNNAKPLGYVLTGGSTSVIGMKILGFEVTGSGLAICVVTGILAIAILMGLLLILMKAESAEKIILAMAEWRKNGQNEIAHSNSRSSPNDLP
jgi:hypothetical protein